MIKYEPLRLEEIRAAQKRVSEELQPTPLVRFNGDDASQEIYLKLENLQPIRAFKIRAGINAIKTTDKEKLKNGVWTVSAGNWAQGLAWAARKLGVKCTCVVPNSIPKIKEDSIRRLGADVVKVPSNVYWDTYATRRLEGMKGTFIHAFSDRAVIAGNGTIGLEILEKLPDVDAVVIPWGGGGLACGIASAIHALKPDTKIFVAEADTAMPLSTAFKAGHAPKEVPYTPSFIDGAGAPWIFPEMWDLAKQLVNGTIVVSLKEVVDAIRLLAERNCLIAEGAGAVSLAAALSGKAGKGKIVCIVSGGNIDPSKLVKILQGQVP
ncbi:MAG: threonine/serine dehydratase [Candidatus Bathyarchaeota archaeon]|nr:threonine/serine dehydratase [Candidatus Bathyarchaeota archaeon]